MSEAHPDPDASRANGEAEEEAHEVTLVDESGLERRFRLHDVFDLDDGAYYLVEAVDDPDQVLLLRDTAGGLESVGAEEMDEIMKRLDGEDPEPAEDGH